MKNNKPISETIGIFSGIILLILFSLNITNIRSDMVIQIAIYWCFSAVAFLSVLIKNKIKFNTALLICFSVYSIIVTVINQDINSLEFYTIFGYITLWIWIIIIFTNVSNTDVYEKLFNWFSIYSILIGIFIINNYTIRKEIGDFGFVNNNYYLLCSMPMLFFAKKGYVKKIGFAVAILTVLMSLKRTGILSLCLMGVCIFIYRMRKSSHFKFTTFFAIVLFIVVTINYDKIVDALGVDVLSRFQTLEEDKGSGRIDIYKFCFDVITNGGIFKFIFGSGYNALIRVHGSELSSHNDILEIIIDYGLIGIVFYFGVVWRYIKICSYNIKKSTSLAEPCIVSLCAFTLLTFFGHCVIYPSYFMFLLIFWIYAEKKTKYKVVIQNLS